MTSYVDALTLIREKAAGFERTSESVVLEQCIGRTTSRAVESSWLLPAFDTSAMDGFAVRSEETVGASEAHPVTLKIQGGLAAGDFPVPAKHITQAAWEIMTGAPFPDGFDACVRQEDITRRGNELTITKPAARSQNRRIAGEDFKVGSTVVNACHTLRAEDLLCFAALGITTVDVYRRLKVAVIATGKELVEADEIPHGAQIRNSTTPYLLQSLKLRGVETFPLGRVGDDPADFLKKIEEANEADLILTTGAISVGKYDFVAKALKERGLETYFQKVKIRPGKPLLFGRLPGGTFVLGLPGNPVATATGFRFFVDPLLRALEGREPERAVQAHLARKTHKTKEATCFLKANLTRTADGYSVETHENQKASMTSPLLRSNAWVALGELAPEDVAKHTLVDVFPFQPAP